MRTADELNHAAESAELTEPLFDETTVPVQPPAETADSPPTGPPEKRQKKPPKKKKKKTTLELFLGFLLKLAVIAAAVWAVLAFVLGVTIHYGNNMFPALRDGDLIVAYRLQRPYLNAAVLYRHDGELRMGRVVGMPGNEVNVTEDGLLTINGTAPAEEVFYPTYPAEAAELTYPYTVGNGQVFILNDFRSDTNDSRSFGAVDMQDVIGPVLLTIRRRGF